MKMLRPWPITNIIKKIFSENSHFNWSHLSIKLRKILFFGCVKRIISISFSFINLCSRGSWNWWKFLPVRITPNLQQNIFPTATYCFYNSTNDCANARSMPGGNNVDIQKIIWPSKINHINHMYFSLGSKTMLSIILGKWRKNNQL